MNDKTTPSPEIMKLTNDLYVKCVKPEIDLLHNKLATANKQVFLLIKRLQEAKRDSERLDWLNERFPYSPDYPPTAENLIYVIGPQDGLIHLRDAIDAVSNPKQEKEGDEKCHGQKETLYGNKGGDALCSSETTSTIEQSNAADQTSKPDDQAAELLLEWIHGTTISMDSSMRMGISYDWFGWESLRQEAHTPIGKFAVWKNGNQWETYGGSDHWYQSGLSSEADAKNSVAKTIIRRLQDQQDDLQSLLTASEAARELAEKERDKSNEFSEQIYNKYNALQLAKETAEQEIERLKKGLKETEEWLIVEIKAKETAEQSCAAMREALEKIVKILERNP